MENTEGRIVLASPNGEQNEIPILSEQGQRILNASRAARSARQKRAARDLNLDEWNSQDILDRRAKLAKNIEEKRRIYHRLQGQKDHVITMMELLEVQKYELEQRFDLAASDLADDLVEHDKIEAYIKNFEETK